MNREKVDSSTIKSIGYDPDHNSLHVEFNSGEVYKYHNVPADHHKMLMESKSKGKHFVMFIKRNFKFTKL